MNNTYILTDSSNLFHRQINMAPTAADLNSKIGMALHMILYSLRKEYVKWKGTHTVYFMEGRSWRYDVHTSYKANRKIEFAKKSIKEQEEREVLTEAFNDLSDYIETKTNITVIRNPNAEADDMIYLWVETHPDDNHVLVSSDSDFFRLFVFPNVSIYDPVKNILIKRDGIYNDDGEKLAFTLTTDAKIKVGKPDENFQAPSDWHEYALFLKCIRGDGTDYIFSAYPGVREKGTKDKIGIRAAFEDRHQKGYNWNNFMMNKWTDPDGNEVQVKDRYEFNKSIIDLTLIPDHIKASGYKTISEATTRKNVPAIEIGTSFMRFVGKWDLRRIGNNAQDFMPMLKAKYNES